MEAFWLSLGKCPGEPEPVNGSPPGQGNYLGYPVSE
jgi:hypothetical protein